MRLIRLALLTFSALSLFACAGEATPRKYKAKRVVILFIDGPRYSETWGDETKQYIPNMAQKLAPQGVVYTNFFNLGPTYTNAGHSAVTTGHYQEIDNKGKQLPDNPSIFQRYLATTKAPMTDAWLITSKDKLDILANSAHPEWKDKFLCSTDCGKAGNGTGYRDDTVTWERVQSLLKEHHPHLVLINFKEPDASGHAKKWDAYLQGIRDTDVYALKLWEFLQADPEYKDQTAYFITNDHGRHIDGRLDGFISHGDECSGCRHINLFAAGPDFKQGLIVTEKRSQIDIAATVAEIMGIPLSETKGQVLTEIFK